MTVGNPSHRAGVSLTHDRRAVQMLREGLTGVRDNPIRFRFARLNSHGDR